METILITVAFLVLWVTAGFIGFLLDARFAKDESDILPIWMWVIYSFILPIVIAVDSVIDGDAVHRLEKRIIWKVRGRK